MEGRTILTGKGEVRQVDSEIIQPGDWVLVLAQVTERKTHSDDLFVRVTTHNTDYEVEVGRSEAVLITPPDAVERCTTLTRPYSDRAGPHFVGLLVRCEKHHDHGGKHNAAPDFVWTDEDVVGHMEDG